MMIGKSSFWVVSFGVLVRYDVHPVPQKLPPPKDSNMISLWDFVAFP